MFGVCLVNDWSARDIQAWEYVPLGPFLGKSFADLDVAVAGPAGRACRRRGSIRRPAIPAPLPYLDDTDQPPWGLDLDPAGLVEWTTDLGSAVRHHVLDGGPAVGPPDRQRRVDAHRGPVRLGHGQRAEEDQRGALIEITWNGTNPLRLADATVREYLADGDTVTITATAPGPGSSVIGFGEVTGTIRPATPEAAENSGAASGRHLAPPGLVRTSRSVGRWVDITVQVQGLGYGQSRDPDR